MRAFILFSIKNYMENKSIIVRQPLSTLERSFSVEIMSCQSGM